VSTLPADTVAVVEDDGAMRQAVRRVLEAEGFLTELFETAEAFLASGAASRARCLVLDIRLPGMSGIDLYQHLLSTGNETPTVFVTAHEDARLRRVVLNGTDSYLLKPFLGEILIQAVTRAIAGRPTT
jgi:FixJ family two-component response regulator